MKRLAWSLVLGGWIWGLAGMAIAEEVPPEPFQAGHDKYLKRDYRGAIPLLQKAIEASPKDARAHYYLGYSQYMTRQYAASMKAFQEAYDLDPAYTPVPKPSP